MNIQEIRNKIIQQEKFKFEQKNKLEKTIEDLLNKEFNFEGDAYIKHGTYRNEKIKRKISLNYGSGEYYFKVGAERIGPTSREDCKKYGLVQLEQAEHMLASNFSKIESMEQYIKEIKKGKEYFIKEYGVKDD